MLEVSVHWLYVVTCHHKDTSCRTYLEESPTMEAL